MHESKKVAIELGQEWMRRSINPRNNYEHALNTEKHALMIYQELLSKNSQIGFPEDLVQIVAWWHDTYKSINPGRSLWSSVVEGFAAAKITKEQLGNLLEKSELELVLNAIRYHNVPWIHPLFSKIFPKKFNLLGKILIEADTIESNRKDHPDDALTIKNILKGLPIIKMINWLRRNSYWLFISSDYAKKLLKQN